MLVMATCLWHHRKIVIVVLAWEFPLCSDKREKSNTAIFGVFTNKAIDFSKAYMRLSAVIFVCFDNGTGKLIKSQSGELVQESSLVHSHYKQER